MKEGPPQAESLFLQRRAYAPRTSDGIVGIRGFRQLYKNWEMVLKFPVRR